MASIADFLNIPKKDSCKHLSLGMRYPVFTQWAGFLVPEYEEDSKAESEEYESLKKIIEEYTNDRITCAHDVLLLFCHAISDSISENVKDLNGTISVEFLSKFKNSTEFLETLKQCAKKYSDKIDFRPFLGLNSDNKNNLPLANMLLESGFFKGIELYGTGFVENPEQFLEIFNTARKLNIESRISCKGLKKLKNREEIFELMQNFRPTRVLNPNIAAKKENLKIFDGNKIYPEVIDFIKDNNLHIEFSPAPLLSEKNVDEKVHAIREFAENGIEFSLCSEEMLFFNKPISGFAADLCNFGLFSIEEISKIIEVKSI